MSMRERNQWQMELAVYLAAKLGISELDALILIAVPFAAKYPSVQSRGGDEAGFAGAGPASA